MAKPRGKRIIIRTSLKQGESERINNNWRVLFLDHLAESSNVSESAAKAGISPSRAYKVRREEPAFARLWRAALWEGYTHLETPILKRKWSAGCGTAIRRRPTRDAMILPMPSACSPRTATPPRRPWRSSAMSAPPKCAPRSIARSRKFACASNASAAARTTQIERRSRVAEGRRDRGRPAHHQCPRPEGEGRVPVPLAAARAARAMRARRRLADLDDHGRPRVRQDPRRGRMGAPDCRSRSDRPDRAGRRIARRSARGDGGGRIRSARRVAPDRRPQFEPSLHRVRFATGRRCNCSRPPSRKACAARSTATPGATSSEAIVR
jgi:hypothetical protein